MLLDTQRVWKRGDRMNGRYVLCKMKSTANGLVWLRNSGRHFYGKRKRKVIRFGRNFLATITNTSFYTYLHTNCMEILVELTNAINMHFTAFRNFCKYFRGSWSPFAVFCTVIFGLCFGYRHCCSYNELRYVPFFLGTYTLIRKHIYSNWNTRNSTKDGEDDETLAKVQFCFHPWRRRYPA